MGLIERFNSINDKLTSFMETNANEPNIIEETSTSTEPTLVDKLTNIANAVRSKSDTTSTMTLTEIESAILALPKVQIESGNITFNNKTATLTLGFIPDTLTIYSNDTYNGYRAIAGADFTLSDNVIATAYGNRLIVFVSTRNSSTITFNAAENTGSGSINPTGTFYYKAYKFT